MMLLFPTSLSFYTTCLRLKRLHLAAIWWKVHMAKHISRIWDGTHISFGKGWNILKHVLPSFSATTLMTKHQIYTTSTATLFGLQKTAGTRWPSFDLFKLFILVFQMQHTNGHDYDVFDVSIFKVIYIILYVLYFWYLIYAIWNMMYDVWYSILNYRWLYGIWNLMYDMW